MRIDVNEQDALDALGWAYVKGLIPEPLPLLRPRQVRALIEEVYQRYDPKDHLHWADRLQVYPSEEDPRTLAEVVEEVETWAKARIKLHNSHYRPRNPYRILTVEVDPEKWTDDD